MPSVAVQEPLFTYADVLDWGVLVNECRAFATTQGGDWWALFSLRHDSTGRITRLKESIGGGLCHVTCFNEDDARSLAEHMVSFAGIPKSAVKVTRLSKYQSSRAAR
jgi:hypothetical protein